MSGMVTTDSQHGSRDLLEIGLIFGLILGAIWTPLGLLNSLFVLLAIACVLVAAVRGRWSVSDMGLTQPFSRAALMLAVGAFFCGVVALICVPVRSVGPGHRIPWIQALEYVFWSLQQEFILQSVFFLRFEALVGPR